MNSVFLRVAALLLHALVNIFISANLLDSDISGSWTAFTGFVLVMLVLLYLFIQHIFRFITFIKNNSK